MPDHNFRPKKNHFLFLLPFDAEAFKTCKNTQKNLLISVLSWVGSFVVSDYVLWLGLIEVWEGGGGENCSGGGKKNFARFALK